MIDSSFGKKLGILFYCCEETYSYDDSCYKDWGVSVYSDDRFDRHIKLLLNSVDMIVVYIHWGEEFLSIPNENQVILAKKMSERADYTIGMHSHCIQLIKRNKQGSTVYYSLGNTIFSDLNDSNNLEGLIRMWSPMSKISLSVAVSLEQKTARHRFRKYINGRLSEVSISESVLLEGVLFFLSFLPEKCYSCGHWVNQRLRNIIFRFRRVIIP